MWFIIKAIKKIIGKTMHKCVCVPTPFKLILASMYLVVSVVFFFVFYFKVPTF